MSRPSDVTSGTLTDRFPVPRLRADRVERTALIDRLERGRLAGHRLTLVSGPAGYGKTTLLADWLQSRKVPFAWLGLDGSMDEPSTLLGVLGAAIAGLPVGSRHEVRRPVGVLGVPSVEALEPLLKDFAAPGPSLVIVLDDFHAITKESVHELVEYLIEHAPRRLHIAISTREDPPFRLPRLRARDELTEIRAEDLRFSVDEVRDFFARSMDLPLSETAVELLAARTEGWVAGLQLAGLSLRPAADRMGAVARFSGTDRYILDYLVDEVLAAVSADLRTFLGGTAVLERMSASLCEAVTGCSGAQARLETLETSGLFVTPLDETREWFRYHALFRQVLLTTLDKPAAVEAHARASAWFADRQLHEEAIQHAFSSGNTELAARSIEEALDVSMYRGEYARVRNWVERLPGEVVSCHPLLAVARVGSRFMTGDLAGASEALRQADSLEPIPGEPAVVRPRLAAMAARIAAYSRLPAAEQLSKRALDLTSDEDPLFRSIALTTHGELLCERDTAGAVAAFREANRLSTLLGRPMTLFITVWNLADALIASGERREAVAVCRAALEGQQDGRGRWVDAGGLFLVPLGIAEYEADELEAAEEHLRAGHEMCQRFGLRPVVLGRAERYEVLALHAMGDWDRAWLVLETARELAERHHLVAAEAAMAALRVELRIREGDLAGAAELGETMEESHSTNRLTSARLALAMGRTGQAASLAHSVANQERAAGRVPIAISALGVEALALDVEGRSGDARLRMKKVVGLASGGGYSRAILDLGRPAAGLLRAVRADAPEFVDRLLARLSVDSGSLPSKPARHAADGGGDLVEPLSERELEVLRLVAAGHSNAEIARSLYIGPGTAKWHVHNVLGKLGVERRAQVGPRLAQLGLELSGRPQRDR